jgi:hypothetical protein
MKTRPTKTVNQQPQITELIFAFKPQSGRRGTLEFKKISRCRVLQEELMCMQKIADVSRQSGLRFFEEAAEA